jgi:hypothetical protein
VSRLEKTPTAKTDRATAAINAPGLFLRKRLAAPVMPPTIAINVETTVNPPSQQLSYINKGLHGTNP